MMWRVHECTTPNSRTSILINHAQSTDVSPTTQVPAGDIDTGDIDTGTGDIDMVLPDSQPLDPQQRSHRLQAHACLCCSRHKLHDSHAFPFLIEVLALSASILMASVYWWYFGPKLESPNICRLQRR